LKKGITDQEATKKMAKESGPELGKGGENVLNNAVN